MIKIKNFRWLIAVMLMLATALNYLDRQNLPMVITELRKVMPIDAILLQTIVTDLFPNKVVGSMAGLAGGVGCFGAMLFSLLAGQLIQHIGYSAVFVMIGLMHPLAFLLILSIVGKIKLVKQLKVI
jgi:MFS family permease